MLTKFEVSGFKNFSSPYTFQLNAAKGYNFNADCVQNDVIQKAIIYGPNSIGKSNLGLAIFDLISHVTDKSKGEGLYSHYLHANHLDGHASFKYSFTFSSGTVQYSYTKKDHETLIFESISINDQLFAEINRKNSSKAKIYANGAEHLETDLGDSIISLLTYIKRSTVLVKNQTNQCFDDFLHFVEHMLFFRSLSFNCYIGLEQGSKGIEKDIIEHENVVDFQNFLQKVGIHYQLKAMTQDGSHQLYADFNGNYKPFFEIASQGTQSLALFYFWLQRIEQQKNVSFLFIDEFDAFYHHSLSKEIVQLLKKMSSQVILTTHNTSIMNNDLLRPDCYFVMKEKNIQSLAGASRKELREAHNIEKMYKAGSFGK
ncbi:MAG: ATP-binding protein [Mariprofundaceae bacterium]|nr:ATP-binding protein [Mariprofundaceae bacterium]